MALTFFPGTDESAAGSYQQRIEILMEAAEHYKADVLDPHAEEHHNTNPNYRSSPHDLTSAYNWDEIASLLREIRELPEGNREDKNLKGELLMKLAGVYEVLRGAKMSKLEAVRMALVNEANQLRGDAV